MASTISAATLTVTFTESIVLNGSNMGATNTLSVASINEINQRIVSLDASNERTLFEFGTIIGAGKFITTDVKYLRITNKDDTNGVSLNLESASSNCWVVVLAGQSFILSSATAAIEADDDTTIVAPTLQDVVKISAHSANPIDLDCYIALT
tara:strand:- start:1734 stop:2189 length:456 start_codon:yes stop_codon:yes gene_type:complete